ncbi:MAG TPA: 6-hydroxymethylpterin diphosphokinase MptE-like protein [Anaerolineales bacterium]
MKATLKRALPAPVWFLAREAYLGARRVPQAWVAAQHPWRRESIARLTGWKDKCKGQRAFIIGNGPSLNQTDLSKLRHEFTFGLNRIFLMFPTLGFQTSYLVSVNDLVIEQSFSEITALPIPTFLSWRSRHFFPASSPAPSLPTFLYTTYESPRFARDARGRLWEGATVTNVALQLAYHMGFQQVILIGVDHNFASKGQANKEVVSDGDDPNHFSPAYFGKGFRWQLPDLDTSEIGYRLARAAYEQAGREVLDATVGGKLTVFRKVEYNSLF